MFLNQKCNVLLLANFAVFNTNVTWWMLHLSCITLLHELIRCDAHTFNRYSTLALLCLSDSEPLCCGSLPSDIFIFNWSVITFTRLHRGVLWKHLREKDAPPSAATSSLPPSLLQEQGPHSACWPWWLEDPSHPLFCLFCNKMGCFSLLLQKSTQAPPLRIVAFPCIDVWLVVHIHLLFYALDFKENERGPIMLIGSCSVKRNQGLPC